MEAETPEAAVIGRPTDYSAELVERLCERIEEGESLRAICADEEMPDKRTVLRWLRKHEEFRTQYASARASQADEFLEEISDIAYDASGDIALGPNGFVPNPVAVSRAKLQIDTLKWRMAKQAPKKYGDKLDVTSGDKPITGPAVFHIIPASQRPGAVVGPEE